MKVPGGPVKMAVVPTRSAVLERCTKMSPGLRKSSESDDTRSFRYLTVCESKTNRPDDVAERLSVGVPSSSLLLRPEQPFFGPYLTRSRTRRLPQSSGLTAAS